MKKLHPNTCTCKVCEKKLDRVMVSMKKKRHVHKWGDWFPEFRGDGMFRSCKVKNCKRVQFQHREKVFSEAIARTKALDAKKKTKEEKMWEAEIIFPGKTTYTYDSRDGRDITPSHLSLDTRPTFLQILKDIRGSSPPRSRAESRA